MIAEFDDVRAEADEFVDAGDHVVVPGRFSARGKRSGAPVDLTITFVYTVRGGKIARMPNFQEKAEALRAAGRTE
jgi:ketosteroid isomerase-like protein